MSFRTIFGKSENRQKTLGKRCWTNFVKTFFRRVVGQCSEYFRFCLEINYLLTGLLVPYHEILSPRFLRTDLARSVRTSKPRE